MNNSVGKDDDPGGRSGSRNDNKEQEAASPALTKKQQKEILLEKNRRAVKENRERAARGDPQLRPRKNYEDLLPARSSSRSKGKMPIQTENKQMEMHNESFESDNDSHRAKFADVCSTSDAVNTFKMHSMATVWDKETSQKSDCKLARPYPISIVDDDTVGISINIPDWVKNVRVNLNHNPFGRTLQQSYQVKKYNEGWKHWLLCKANDGLEAYVAQNEFDGSDGSKRSLDFGQSLNGELGVISSICDALSNPSFGPPIPQSAAVSKSTRIDELPFVNVPSQETAKRQLTLEILNQYSANQRKVLGRHDKPFKYIFGQPLNATFGFFNDQLINNEDMMSLVPKSTLTSPIMDTCGHIIGSRSIMRTGTRSCHFISSSEFIQATSGNVGLKEEVINKIMARMVHESRNKNINLIAVCLNPGNHYVLALTDLTTHQLNVYDPMMNGGRISLNDQDELNHEICNQVLKLRQLLSVIRGETANLWVPESNYCDMLPSHPSLGIQIGSIDCGVYVLLFLELITELKSPNDKVFENAIHCHWDLARKYFFEMIMDALQKSNSLRTQPVLVSSVMSKLGENTENNASANTATATISTSELVQIDTPVTSLSKNITDNLQIETSPNPVNHEDNEIMHTPMDDLWFDEEYLDGFDVECDAGDADCAFFEHYQEIPNIAPQVIDNVKDSGLQELIASKVPLDKASSTDTAGVEVEISEYNEKLYPRVANKEPITTTNKTQKQNPIDSRLQSHNPIVPNLSSSSSQSVSSSSQKVQQTGKKPKQSRRKQGLDDFAIITSDTDDDFDGQNDEMTMVPNYAVNSITFVKIHQMTDAEKQQNAGIIKNTTISVKFSDLLCFRCDERINVSVMNAVGVTICQRAKCMPGVLHLTFIDPKYAVRIINNLVNQSITGRPNSLFNLINSIRLTKRILMPHEHGGSHWILFIMEYDAGVLSVYDPYFAPNAPIKDAVLLGVMKRIAKCVSRVLREGVKLEKKNERIWAIREAYTGNLQLIPIQRKNDDDPNHSDIINSGIFVLSYIEAYISSEDFDPKNCMKLGDANAITRKIGTRSLRVRFFKQLLQAFGR